MTILYPPVRRTLQRVTRAKLDGRPGTHHGVLVNELVGFAWHQRVVHFDDEGFHEESLARFAAGRSVFFGLKVDQPEVVANAMRRLERAEAVAPKYKLLDCNCEHVANFILTGEVRSDQVAMAVGIFAVLGGIALAVAASRK